MLITHGRSAISRMTEPKLQQKLGPDEGDAAGRARWRRCGARVEQILADGLARAGFWVQSFPEFTAERRGAPISAFLRWDETSPIHRRYKVRDYDVLAVVSPSPPAAQVLQRIRPGGLLLLNRGGDPDLGHVRGCARSGFANSAGERDPRRRVGRWATWLCSAP